MLCDLPSGLKWHEHMQIETNQPQRKGSEWGQILGRREHRKLQVRNYEPLPISNDSLILPKLQAAYSDVIASYLRETILCC
jgi:hypothetical protein